MIYTAGQLPYSFNWLGDCVFLYTSSSICSVGAGGLFGGAPRMDGVPLSIHSDQSLTLYSALHIYYVFLFENAVIWDFKIGWNWYEIYREW